MAVRKPEHTISFAVYLLFTGGSGLSGFGSVCGLQPIASALSSETSHRYQIVTQALAGSPGVGNEAVANVLRAGRALDKDSNH